MDELASVIQDVEKLHGVLMKLKEKQETQAHDVENDFWRLYHYAKFAPIAGHKLAEQDEFIRWAYLRMLAGLVSQTGDGQSREKKIIHIGRILAAMPDGNLERLFADAATITVQDLDDFRENLPENLRPLFLFDLLLLCWLNGKAEDAELRYAAEFMNMFAMPAKQSEGLANAVKAVLRQDFDTLPGPAENIDSSLFLSYFDQSECTVALTFEEAVWAEGESVIIFNAEISDMDSPIDIDDAFLAKHVEFHHCIFRNMRGFFAEKTPVKIMNCRFEQCAVKQNLLALNNAEISNTYFGNCCAKSAKHKNFYLIACQSSKISNCVFSQCEIRNEINSGSFAVPLGGLLGTCASTVTNCSFLSCSLKGCGYLVCMESGRISQCEFKRCLIGSILANVFEGGFINCVNSALQQIEFQDCSGKEYDNKPERVCDINGIMKKQRSRV